MAYSLSKNDLAKKVSDGSVIAAFQWEDQELGREVNVAVDEYGEMCCTCMTQRTGWPRHMPGPCPHMVHIVRDALDSTRHNASVLVATSSPGDAYDGCIFVDPDVQQTYEVPIFHDWSAWCKLTPLTEHCWGVAFTLKVPGVDGQLERFETHNWGFMDPHTEGYAAIRSLLLEVCEGAGDLAKCQSHLHSSTIQPKDSRKSHTSLEYKRFHVKDTFCKLVGLSCFRCVERMQAVIPEVD